jgi:hypothetical protein
MSEQQKEWPTKAQSQFFQICANNTFIFGMDGQGYVWSRPACEVEAEWKCLGRPDVEPFYKKAN